MKPKETPLCNHIKTNGCVCESPALKDEDYCYFHIASRARRRRQQRAARLNLPFQLPLLEDANPSSSPSAKLSTRSSPDKSTTRPLVSFSMACKPLQATSATPTLKSRNMIAGSMSMTKKKS